VATHPAGVKATDPARAPTGPRAKAKVLERAGKGDSEQSINYFSTKPKGGV